MNEPRTLDEAASELDSLLNGEIPEGEDDEEDQEEVETDEADDEDAEDAEDEDGDDDDEAEEGEEEDEPELYTVKVNGVESKVTLDELRKSYQLDKHITEKSERASQAMREAEKALQERNAERERLKEALAQYAVQETPEPDWFLYLAQGYTPQQVSQAKQKWHQQQQQSEQAKAAYRELVEQQEQEQRSMTEAQLKEEQGRLLQAIPEWSDKTVAQKQIAEMAVKMEEHFGLPQQVLASVTDANQILILRDAIAYRELRKNNAAAEKRVSKPGKSLRPGSKTSAKQRAGSRMKQAQARFQKSPTMENAAQAISGLLDF